MFYVNIVNIVQQQMEEYMFSKLLNWLTIQFEGIPIQLVVYDTSKIDFCIKKF